MPLPAGSLDEALERELGPGPAGAAVAAVVTTWTRIGRGLDADQSKRRDTPGHERILEALVRGTFCRFPQVSETPSKVRALLRHLSWIATAMGPLALGTGDPGEPICDPEARAFYRRSRSRRRRPAPLVHRSTGAGFEPK